MPTPTKENKTATQQKPSTPCDNTTAPCPACTLRLESLAVATSPVDRTRTQIGVGEDVRLTALGGQGGVDWSVVGKSKLSATSGTAVTLTAHDRAETVTVQARDEAGCVASIQFTIIEPTGVLMERAPGAGIFHTNGVPSVGMKLSIYIQPDSVSFENIEICEDDCKAEATGYLATLNGLRHAGHGAGNWVTVSGPDAGKGSIVDGTDRAEMTAPFGTPYADGRFHWPIPWQYRVSSGSPKTFATVDQVFTSDSTGKMTVSKGGASASAELNDPSSTY